MAFFLSSPGAAPDVTSAYNPVNRTLQVDLSPGHTLAVPFPLRPGTFEHLSPAERKEVALFLWLKGQRSEDTLRRYTAELEKFLVFLQVVGHGVIDEWAVLHYQQQLLAPSPALRAHPVVCFQPVVRETADQYLNVVRSFAQHLADKGLLGYNPAKQVRRLGVRDAQVLAAPKHFNTEQWAAVLATLDALPADTPGQRRRAERLRFCIRFGYALGLRVKEQASHTHAHIVCREQRCQLKIIGKGLRARLLSLDGVDDIALDALTRYRTFLGLPAWPNQEPLPLLPSVKPVVIKTKGPHQGLHINTKAIATNTWEEQFKLFLQREVMHYLYPDNPALQAQVFTEEWAQLTPHSLRHTRITDLVKQGKDLFWIQKFAGHENLNTTRRYFHEDL